jgi:ribonucleoside-diphosphate reductase alpha chain
MTARRRLPNRRPSTNFDIESLGLRFTVSSTIEGGQLREVFINNHKAGSAAGIMANDLAVVCSIALQYGVPLEVIRKALMRDANGKASSPLAKALDIIAAEMEDRR